jgi:hypothetical protein
MLRQESSIVDVMSRGSLPSSMSDPGAGSWPLVLLLSSQSE